MMTRRTAAMESSTTEKNATVATLRLRSERCRYQRYRHHHHHHRVIIVIRVLYFVYCQS